MGDTKRAGTIGQIAIFATYLWIAVDAALIADLFFVAMTGTDVFAGLVGGLAVATVGLLLICAILTLIWIHRAMSVAHELTPTLTISPGAAVGWWFVPLANFVLPFQAMREIWEGSAPDDDTGSGNALLGIWWAAWIVRAVAGGLQRVFAEDIEMTLILLLTAGLAGIASAGLLTVIIQRINRMQAGAVDTSIFA